MAVSTITSKMSGCQYPFAQGKICNWVGYEIQVTEGIINDMDEPLTLRDASSPEPESGEERSISPSLSPDQRLEPSRRTGSKMASVRLKLQTRKRSR